MLSFVIWYCCFLYGVICLPNADTLGMNVSFTICSIKCVYRGIATNADVVELQIWMMCVQGKKSQVRLNTLFYSSTVRLFVIMTAMEEIIVIM